MLLHRRGTGGLRLAGLVKMGVADANEEVQTNGDMVSRYPATPMPCSPVFAFHRLAFRQPRQAVGTRSLL